MARILTVGTVTLDLVFGLQHHPDADEEMRAESLRTARGGNAANSAVVLAQLGHQLEFLGTLADAPETSVISQDFAHYGVDFSHCPCLPGRPPTSSIYLAGDTRSIVHYRDLPELSFDDFKKALLQAFDWVHFEGRNIEAVTAMMLYVREARPGLPISLELEKPRDGIASLFGLADLLICSRHFARHMQHVEPHDFLPWMQQQAPQAQVVLAAGEQGAYALDDAGVVHHAPAMPPPKVLDTLGAGDTFNAALIDAAIRELSLPKMLEAACSLAGQKCGVLGFELGLKAK
ncbi:MAG TPA: PfkB family carbohydrate kinase [Methylophilaceae bacterium]|jgi:ketohexokinase